MLKLVLFSSILSFLITFVSTPFVIKLANRFSLVDDPEKRKHPAHVHKRVVPRAGGLAIYLGIFSAALFSLPLTKNFMGIFLGASLTVLIGLLDDKYDLNPYVRLVGNFFAAALVVGAGVGIAYITNPFNGIIHLDQPRIDFNFFGPHSVWILSDILALVFIVWTMNMVNWSKGVPGQMPGIAAIAALTLGILSSRFALEDPSQVPISLLCFITASSFLGFLPFNFDPQKIMPGYGGGALAGFMLAVLSILSFGKLATALLVLAIPTFDAVFAVVRRVASGHSPVWADRGHLHHKLLDLGWSFRKIALFYWVICAILGVAALALQSEGKLFAFLLVGVVFLGGLLWLSKLSDLSKHSELDSGSKT